MGPRKADGSPTLATSVTEKENLSGNIESIELLTPYELHVKKSFVSLVKPRSLSYCKATSRNWDPTLISSSAKDILSGPDVPCVALSTGTADWKVSTCGIRL